MNLNILYTFLKKDDPRVETYNGIYVLKEYDEETYYIPKMLFSYDSIVDKLVRDRYQMSQEFAILRQKDIKPEEFQIYFNYVEECKTTAKNFMDDVAHWELRDFTRKSLHTEQINEN